MMSEIEKLYELAGIEKDWRSLPYSDIEEYYPPFTAEKQLALLQYIEKLDWIDELRSVYRPFEEMWLFQIYIVTEFVNEKSVTRLGAGKNFVNGLASLINNLWQDLTETEQEEIRKILKG